MSHYRCKLDKWARSTTPTSKNGSCALLAAIEPLTGKRLAEVFPQRTMREYTAFCQAIVARWPEAQTIRLVQDNLNTHTTAAFYKYLPADAAFELAQKFDFYYTPKSARWLNMIEIEFSLSYRQAMLEPMDSDNQHAAFRSLGPCSRTTCTAYSDRLAVFNIRCPTEDAFSLPTCQSSKPEVLANFVYGVFNRMSLSPGCSSH